MYSLIKLTLQYNQYSFRSRRLFTIKLKLGGSINKHKSRLVAKKYSQLEGVDVDETFSLVDKATTIREVLSIEVSLKGPITQLDVKMSFYMGIH